MSSVDIPESPTLTTSPSPRKITSRVWEMIAATSLAMMYSSSPTPTTSGLPCRAATRVSGSSVDMTAMP